jgi:UDP-N-acetylmuramate--alanine ligase
VGTANEITVIDDFAHNPDKISATLETMHALPGCLLLMFQPHGYGPIRLMRNALVDCFASGLHAEDVRSRPSSLFGGTVDRSVGSRHHSGHRTAWSKGPFFRIVPPGDALVKLARRDRTWSGARVDRFAVRP